MNIAKSSGPQLVPPEGDPSALFELKEPFLVAAEKLKGDLRRTLYWALRLMFETTTLSTFARNTAGFRQPAFGFLDPETERDAFGVILLTAFTPDTHRRRVEGIKVEDYVFPVVVRPVEEIAHQTIPNPAKGTGTCWARSRIQSPSPRGPGILTAKHVVSKSRYRPVKMSCGCDGRVVDVAPDGIDAALVVCNCSPPRAKRAVARQVITPFMDVDFTGATSGHKLAKVTAVTDSRGIFSSAALPVRFFLSEHGQPGDSGALISDSASRDPLGLYMAAYKDPAGGTGGIAQHLYQAAALMDMEIYT